MFLMVLVSTTLVIFFGMVVAIGQLIHAKINLQNAVDFTAMAGASYQARYLNQIAAVNYRIRQNYKWLLFDLYVTESRFNKDWQSQSEDPNTMAFGICQQVPLYRPVALIGEQGDGINDKTHFCQNMTGSGGVGALIPTLITTPILSPDPIIIAINATILKLKAQFEATCVGFSGQNKAYAKWILKQMYDKNVFQLKQMSTIVKEFQRGMSPQGGYAGKGAMDSTFQKNLIRANGNANWAPFAALGGPPSFLAPNTASADFATAISQGGTSGSTIRKYFETPSIQIQTRYADFINTGAGCSTQIKYETSPPVSLGVARTRSGEDPFIPIMNILTATSSPNILFWPGNVTPVLVAVSAAKPFGSRIAPPASVTGTETRIKGAANMKFTPNDSKGMFNRTILNGALRDMPQPDSGSNTARPKVGDRFFNNWIAAPTKFEAFFYNPFPSSAGGITSQINSAFTPEIGEIPSLKSDDQELYNCLDRGDCRGNWHTVPLAGGSNYADEDDIQSSWEGRMGYQIKLISLGQAAQELKNTSEGTELKTFIGTGLGSILH